MYVINGMVFFMDTFLYDFLKSFEKCYSVVFCIVELEGVSGLCFF